MSEAAPRVVLRELPTVKPPIAASKIRSFACALVMSPPPRYSVPIAVISWPVSVTLSPRPPLRKFFMTLAPTPLFVRIAATPALSRAPITLLLTPLKIAPIPKTSKVPIIAPPVAASFSRVSSGSPSISFSVWLSSPGIIAVIRRAGPDVRYGTLSTILLSA